MALSLRFSAQSDIGRRKKNDDSGYAGAHFVMIADGMGGAPHGNLASSVAVQTMQRLDTAAPDDLLEALAGAVHRANDRLAEVIEEDASTEGMGTTVTAALFDGTRIGVAHLGDSRGYLWRDGELLRLTSDHSWVQSLIDEGRITEEEAATHSHRSLLLKVLDGRHDNDPDLTLYDVQAGDRILLCSDGLSGFVPHDRLERALSIGSTDAAVGELVQLALENNSNDNITVVLADVVDEPADDAVPLVVGAAADEPRTPRGRLRTWAQRDTVAAPGEALLDPDDDPEQLRYAPREQPRWLGLRRLGVLVVTLALLVGLGVAGYAWTQQQYYVGAHAGRVVIFQGVEDDIPGIELSSVHEEFDLDLDELPAFRRSEVIEGIEADNLDDARKIVDELETFARTCANQSSRTTAPSGNDTTTATGTETTTPTRNTNGEPTGTGQTGSVDTTTRSSQTRATAQTTGRPSAPSTKPIPSVPGSLRPSDPTDTATTDASPGDDEDTGGTSAAECAGATPMSETS